jgi:antitoxin (DNA-binding transcriptional repressor) of toxin-antitoxin stability system
MNPAVEIINTKELRSQMPRVLRSVRKGKRFLVLHRSKPAFELVSPSGAASPLPPLEQDPVFNWSGVGESSDGLGAADHDRVLYGR